MRTACLLIQHLPLQVEGQRQPDLKGRPVIVAGPDMLVLDASTEAAGVRCGRPLSQAIACCPSAVVIPAEPALYEEAWEQVLGRLEEASPAAESAGLGHAYADVRGLERLYGGEEKLAQTLLDAAASFLDVRLGLASAKFPAYVAATVASGRWTAAPEDVAGFLAPFPLDFLPLPKRIIDRLRSFGLQTLGDVARMPLSALQAQFGKAGRLAWELSQGIDRRPLLPREHKVVVKESVDLQAPLSTVEGLLVAVEGLLGRAFRRPELRSKCARVAFIEAEITGQASFSKRIIFKEPAATREQAFSVLKRLLSGLCLPGPVESLSLTLSEIGGEAGRQASLFNDVRRRDDLRQAMRELQARYGSNVPIYQVRDIEQWSRIPERRRALLPYAP